MLLVVVVLVLLMPWSLTNRPFRALPNKHPRAWRRPGAKQTTTVLATTTPPHPAQARTDCARLTARTSAMTTVKATTPARKRFLSHFLLPSGSFLLVPLEASGHRILSTTFRRVDNGDEGVRGDTGCTSRKDTRYSPPRALFISRHENTHSLSRDVFILHKTKSQLSLSREYAIAATTCVPFTKKQNQHKLIESRE